MTTVAMDTATASTTAAVRLADGREFERRHDPEEGERPGHAGRLLMLLADALSEAGVGFGDVTLVAAGVGPGSFTGLRIGLATARGLAHGLGVPVAGVSTLEALATGAVDLAAGGTVLGLLDARRGEVFAAAWQTGEGSGSGLGERLLAPCAIAPEAFRNLVQDLPQPVLAIGDGALRFGAQLEAAGALLASSAAIHRVSARHVCRLAAPGRTMSRDELVPDYVRAPDARRTAAAPR